MSDRLSVPPSLRPKTRAMMLATSVSAILGFACAGHEVAPKYQVASNETAVSVGPTDYGVEPAIFERAGTHLLIPEPTHGQFPTGLCVAQVEAFLDPANKRRLRVVTLPQQHAIYWNHLLDNLPPLREVVFLGQSGIDPRGCQIDDILKAAVARNCELCLIYSRVDRTDADAEYVGMVWAGRTGKPLASVRAPVVLPIDIDEHLKGKPDSDVAITEADFRSEQDLRRMVRDLLWDLAGQDLESASKEQNPWQNYTPPVQQFDRFRFPWFDQPTPYNSPGERKKNRRGADAKQKEDGKEKQPAESADHTKSAVAGDARTGED